MTNWLIIPLAITTIAMLYYRYKSNQNVTVNIIVLDDLPEETTATQKEFTFKHYHLN